MKKVFASMKSVNQLVSPAGSWEVMHTLPYMTLLGRLIDDSERPEPKGLLLEDIEIETCGRDWTKTQKLLRFWERKGLIKTNGGCIHFLMKFKAVKEKEASS